MSNYNLLKESAKNQKLFYIIIGNQGSGKTVLANQLKSKIGSDVQIFDDFFYMGVRPKATNDIMSRVSRCRHTGEKTIATMHYIPKEQFNFKTNNYITWILTSIGPEIYYHLRKHLRLRSKKILKFAKSYKRSALGLTKTRPYLIMTVNNRKVNYEIHRFKNKPVNENAQRSRT